MLARISFRTSKTSKVVVAFSEHATICAVVFDHLLFPPVNTVRHGNVSSVQRTSKPGGVNVQFVLTLTTSSGELSKLRAVVTQYTR